MFVKKTVRKTNIIIDKCVFKTYYMFIRCEKRTLSGEKNE